MRRCWCIGALCAREFGGEAEEFGVLRRVGSAPSPGQRRCGGPAATIGARQEHGVKDKWEEDYPLETPLQGLELVPWHGKVVGHGLNASCGLLWSLVSSRLSHRLASLAG